MRNLKERIGLHILSIPSLVEQVSSSCEWKWEIYEFDHERIPYCEEEWSFEGEEDLGKGCSPRIEFEGEDPYIGENSCNSPTCFENSLLLRWECASSCHEMEYSEDVDSLNYFQ